MTASTMDVMGYFSDADGDTLTYSAMSSDMAVATATVAEGTSMLTVTPVGSWHGHRHGDGRPTRNGSGMSFTQMFMVTVEAAPGRS